MGAMRFLFDATPVFRLDAETGHLTPAGAVAVPNPVCVLLGGQVR